LLIYNGADDKNIYSTGWVLFDKKDPTKVLSRAGGAHFFSRARMRKSRTGS